jgi:putative transposase
MSGISKGQVSRPCEEIDDTVKGFLDRPIDGDWPYSGSTRPTSRSVAAGASSLLPSSLRWASTPTARGEVLGMEIGTSEAEAIWTEFLRKLTRRGLRGVKLVVSDAHEGIKGAVSKVLPATRQRCRVHFMRNALAQPERADGASCPPSLPRRLLRTRQKRQALNSAMVRRKRE